MWQGRWQHTMRCSCVQCSDAHIVDYSHRTHTVAHGQHGHDQLEREQHDKHSLAAHRAPPHAHSRVGVTQLETCSPSTSTSTSSRPTRTSPTSILDQASRPQALPPHAAQAAHEHRVATACMMRTGAIHERMDEHGTFACQRWPSFMYVLVRLRSKHGRLWELRSGKQMPFEYQDTCECS